MNRIIIAAMVAYGTAWTIVILLAMAAVDSANQKRINRIEEKLDDILRRIGK